MGNFSFSMDLIPEIFQFENNKKILSEKVKGKNACLVDAWKT